MHPHTSDALSSVAEPSDSRQPGFRGRLSRSTRWLRSAPSSSSSSATLSTPTVPRSTIPLELSQSTSKATSDVKPLRRKRSDGRPSVVSASKMPSPAESPSSPAGGFSRFTTRLRAMSNPKSDVNDRNYTSLLSNMSKDAPAIPKLPRRPVARGHINSDESGGLPLDAPISNMPDTIEPSAITNLELRSGKRPEILVHVRGRKQAYSSREFKAFFDRQIFKNLIQNLSEARGNPAETTSIKVQFTKEHIAVIARRSRNRRNVYPTLLNNKTVLMGVKGLNR